MIFFFFFVVLTSATLSGRNVESFAEGTADLVWLIKLLLVVACKALLAVDSFTLFCASFCEKV